MNVNCLTEICVLVPKNLYAYDLEPDLILRVPALCHRLVDHYNGLALADILEFILQLAVFLGEVLIMQRAVFSFR